MPTPARDETEFARRFWAKVEKTAGCWAWMGARTTAGYGSLKRDQRVLYAHRVSYEMAHGSVARGLCVLHRCDAPWCVRPDHLFAGTRLDNNRDCAAKGRGNSGPGSRTARLTGTEVREIRRLYAEGNITQDALARRYGVAQMTVSDIVTRRSWKML